MGVESFGLVMRAERRIPTAEIDNAIRAYPGILHVVSNFSGTAYEYFDGSHLFEVLLRSSDTEVEFDLSARFALCNPEDIKLPFTGFLRWAIEQWQPSVIWFLTSRLRKTPLTPGDYETFLASGLPAEIQALQKYWQSHFGLKRGAVRVEAAWAFAGIVNAEPGAPPNGGPATQLGNSGALEGPPSVS